MPSGLPTIIPSASGDEDAGTVDWGKRVEQIGCWGEEFVGERQDAGGEGGRNEVCWDEDELVWDKGFEAEKEAEGPMQVELKVELMRSAGMESIVPVGWGLVSWMISGESA